MAVPTAFVQTSMQLYLLRFLLGATEAGFFPGTIICSSYWFRKREQATTIAMFTAAPFSTWILDHFDHLAGLIG